MNGGALKLGRGLPSARIKKSRNSAVPMAGGSSDSINPGPLDGQEAKRRQRILSSELYIDVPSTKLPVIYSSSYDIKFMGIEKLHPFDSSKWGHIHRFLISEGILDPGEVVEPVEASKDDLLVRKVLHPFRKQVGGTVLAGKLAKERGWAINIGGGFHHCSGNKGAGFCPYADISLCIQFAFTRLGISKVMIIDLDAHQGNGHAMTFADDGRVYILDMYNREIYPQDFEARRYIHQRVELLCGASTKEYLERLDKALEIAKDAFDPELVFYNAGTDILDGDPLGKLKVKPEGVILRDEKVFAFAQQNRVPIIMVTSGGYMKSSARVIADSIINLTKKHLIELNK